MEPTSDFTGFPPNLENYACVTKKNEPSENKQDESSIIYRVAQYAKSWFSYFASKIGLQKNQDDGVSSDDSLDIDEGWLDDNSASGDFSVFDSDNSELEIFFP